MTPEQTLIHQLCLQAIERVELAIARHKRGQDEDLSVPVLENVRQELTVMAEMLDVEQFDPGFPRFILDWPDEHGLIQYLIGIASRYRS